MPTDRSVFVERLLQVHLAAMAALGTLMLGMGERSATMPLVMLCVAGGSIWLTDVTGRFRLNRLAANLGALVIGVFILTREFSRFGSEVHILGVAHLLVYLQILLLLQKKRQREYVQLAVLSLLQVVVASAFSQGVWFGVVLAVYMMAGLSVLVLLFLFRQWTVFEPNQGTHPFSGELGIKGKPGGKKLAHTAKKEPRSSAAGRWPLTTKGAAFVNGAADDSAAGVGWVLSCRLGAWGAGTLALTALLFLTLPRLGQTAWRGAIVRPHSIVGFSSKVTLGELGETIEDPKEVLRVRFFDHRTGEPYAAGGPVYLHGALLMSYRRGEWTAGSAIPSLGYEPLRPTRRPLPPGLVRQEITIEPLNQPELFCVMPFVPTERNDAVQLDFRRKRLLRDDYLRNQRFSYSLGTTALVRGRQQPLTPGEGPTPWRTALEMPDEQDSLPSVGFLAEQWLAQSGIPASDRYGQAKYLEHMLAGSGLFQYSLKGQPRNPTLDPIEDFLTRNRAGHCEYFATALTLMLRSQGIPARMVVGYMTDEYNDAGRFFQVRQLHAHTWVEAHLEPDHIPQYLLHGEQTWGWRHAGGWLQLDPTPPAPEDQLYNPWLQPLRRASLWMEQIWADYILEMDRPRQQEAVYQPVVQSVKRAYESLTSPEWWYEVLQAWSSVGQWISWRGGLAAMLLALMGVLAYRGLRWLWRKAAAGLWPGAAPVAGDDGRRVEFYRRLVALLRKRGLRRAPGQTPYEFATEAANRLAGTPGLEHLASCPQQVVLAFYQVRFGHQPLDNGQQEAVEHALSRLADGSRRLSG